MKQFSGIHTLQTTGQIFFKFGMQGSIYGEHKICEFDKISPVVIEIQTASDNGRHTSQMNLTN